MAAPALDLLAQFGDHVGRPARLSRRRALSQPIEHARKGFGAAGRACQPFLHFVTVDLEVGEHRIGEPTPNRRRAAAGLARRQRARIEIECLGKLDEQRRR
jgi:hypothetical protein